MAVWAVTRLSHSATVPSSHLTRTWKSCPRAICCNQREAVSDVNTMCRQIVYPMLTLNRSCKRASDSSWLRPIMRLVKPLLTNRAFSPVTFELIVSTTHLCLSLLHATYWVNPHNGVLRLHWLSADKLSIAASVLCLVETAVFSTQALKKSLDWLRQASICCGLRCPCGIATGWRNGQEGENGNSGWLMFVRNIGMVPGSCQSFPSLSCPILVVWTKVDVVILEVALDMSSNGLRSRSVFALSHPYEATNMNVQWSEISRKLCLLLWSNILKVLSTEDDHSPLCNQQRKFILLRVI